MNSKQFWRPNEENDISISANGKHTINYNQLLNRLYGIRTRTTQIRRNIIHWLMLPKKRRKRKRKSKVKAKAITNEQIWCLYTINGNNMTEQFSFLRKFYGFILAFYVIFVLISTVLDSFFVRNINFTWAVKQSYTQILVTIIAQLIIFIVHTFN